MHTYEHFFVRILFMEDELGKVYRKYEEVQLLKNEERSASVDEMNQISGNWKNSDVPSLQRQVVNLQLENLKNGIVDPVFTSFTNILAGISLREFTILDAACASGYYSEVIKALDSRKIQYQGCDYSKAMIETAKAIYPEIKFDEEDLTNLSYSDASFDVVMASGILEHIPDYKKAISELCRVSRNYIILHRCPLTSLPNEEYVIGAQYNIETPRIYFSKQVLQEQFKTHGFQITKEIDVYPHQGFLEPSKVFL